MAINREFEVEQIDLISKFLFKILFPLNVDRSKINNFVFDEKLLDLKLTLKNLIDKKQFVEAQNLLLKQLAKDKSDRKVMQLAVWFYLNVDEFDDEVLQKNGFSRYDVLEGFKKVENVATGLVEF